MRRLPLLLLTIWLLVHPSLRLFSLLARVMWFSDGVEIE